MKMLLLFAALLAVSPSPKPDMIGVWDVRASDTTIFRVEIVGAPEGAVATWEQPKHYQTDGESFSHVDGPTVRLQTRHVQSVEGDIELSFGDPAQGGKPEIFRLHRVDAEHADLSFEGFDLGPFKLVRQTSQISQLGPWDPKRRYISTITRQTNAEMAAIFEADQADRNSAKIDWSIVRPKDKKRRARTEELLDTGALQSGEDFYNASFVFQHGDAPDDYLKAHLLAMIAIARGMPEATWIASATLDRYLQAIGKPQVLGTQFNFAKDAPVTQEPYNRGLISDATRKALHVPPIPEQELQRQEYETKEARAHRLAK